MIQSYSFGSEEGLLYQSSILLPLEDFRAHDELAQKLFLTFRQYERIVSLYVRFVLIDKQRDLAHYLYHGQIFNADLRRLEEHLKRVSPKEPPKAALERLLRTAHPIGNSFSRHAQGRSEPTELNIYKDSKYYPTHTINFWIELAVFRGHKVYALSIEEVCGISLIAVFPKNPPEIREIIIKEQMSLRDEFLTAIKSFLPNLEYNQHFVLHNPEKKIYSPVPKDFSLSHHSVPKTKELDNKGKVNSELEQNNAIGRHLKEISDKVNAVLQTVQEGRRNELLALMEQFAEKAQHQPDRPLPADTKEMRAMGIETYSEFKRHTRSTDGKDCLKKNWGVYLKAFSKGITGRELDRDYMSQADLGKLDRQLLKRLKNTMRSEELNALLPGLPALNKQIFDLMTAEEKSEIFRINGLLSRRSEEKIRSLDGEQPDPSDKNSGNFRTERNRAVYHIYQ